MTQTAVEFIEEGIKARQRYWHDQYQQGYQRALSDIMTYIEEAKQMEKEQIIDAFLNGDNSDCMLEQNIKEFAEQYYNKTYGK